MESASQGGGGDYAYTYGGSTNVTVENCIMEDCQIGGAVTGGYSRNVKFAHNRILGRRETYLSTGFVVHGNATSNGFALETTPHLNVQIIDNDAVNIAAFMRIAGYTYGTQVKRNSFISSPSQAGANAQTFIVSNTAGSRHLELEITGNRGITPGLPGPVATVILQNLESGSTVTIDDNAFTPNASGVVFNFSGGDAVFRMKGPNSNRTLPTSLWALIRPPLDQEDYPVGDGNFI